MARLIVGLGNPGKEYEKTRHNVGFRVLETFIDSHRDDFDGPRAKFDSIVLEGKVGREKTILMYPGTFMNLSGRAVQMAAAFWKINPQNILVVYDDKELLFGAIRIRKTGSAGGHNGMKSVIEYMGTQNVPRLRVGIGTVRSKKTDAANYVLGKFSPGETIKMHEVLVRASDAIEMTIKKGLDASMNEFNK